MNLLGLLSVACLATALPPAQTLDIVHIESVYGPLQPVRAAADYFPPHDNLCYRFQVAGLQAKDGRLDIEITTRLLNAKGKLVVFKNLPAKDLPIAPKRPATLFAHLPLTDALPPGTYTAEVTVTDNVSGASGTFQRPVTIKAPEFAVVGVQFAYDAEGKIPASTRIQTGQRLCFRVLVAGFDDRQARVDVGYKIELVEGDSGTVFATHETAVRQAVVAGMHGTMTYNGQTPPLFQAGRYQLRLTLTDQIGEKTMRCTFGVEVVAP